MIIKYSLFFFFLLNICLVSSFQSTLNAQESRIFKRADFSLRGAVKSCLEITKYGKEEFEFNKEGFLTKNLTRFNEQDYNVTYYKYEKDFLVEKRDEVYRDGNFDKQTSIAHFYSVDTTESKVALEEIMSYEGELLERYEYYYDEEDKLLEIIRSNNEGVDETEVSHTVYKSETTSEYSINGVVQKSIRTSVKGKKNEKLILTKTYLNGEAVKAQEEVFNKDKKVISRKEFRYNLDKKSFELEKATDFFYDNAGMLAKENIKTDGSTKSLEYIYQYDDETNGNWVKQIISPENLFKTRKITYYTPDETELPKS